MNGILVTNINKETKIIYNASKADKQYFTFGFLIIFGLIWIPATLWMTALVIKNPYNYFLWFWLVGGYFGSIYIPIRLALPEMI